MGKQGRSISDELETAGVIGRLAHFLVFSRLMGKEPDLSEFPSKHLDLAQHLANQFYDMLEGELLLAEVPLVKPRYGGTPDAVFRSNSRNILVDFKTSKRVYDEHIIQVAAYRHMLSTPHRRLVGKRWVEGDPMPIHRVILLHAPSTRATASQIKIDEPALRLAFSAFRARLLAYETTQAMRRVLI